MSDKNPRLAFTAPNVEGESFIIIDEGRMADEVVATVHKPNRRFFDDGIRENESHVHQERKAFILKYARLFTAAEDLLAACILARQRMREIGCLLNGSPTAENIREAYNLAYPEPYRKAVERAYQQD